MVNTNKQYRKVAETVQETKTEATNKCKFCKKLIGDYVSNYHIGCYKQKNLLEEKENEGKYRREKEIKANELFDFITRFGIKHLSYDELIKLEEWLKK